MSCGCRRSSYDDWLELDTAHRWAQLVLAWHSGLRAIGLIGRRDSGGATAAARERLVNALAPDLERLLAPEVRQLDAGGSGEAGAGTAPGVESVVTWVAWHRPRRGGQFRDDLVEWTHHRGCPARSDWAGCVGFARSGRCCRRSLLPRPWLLPSAVGAGAGVRGAAAGGPHCGGSWAAGPRSTRGPVVMADAESHGGGGVYRFSESSITAGVRPRPYCGATARVAGRALPYAGAAAAQLPHRRRGQATRRTADRGGVDVPALR